MKHLVFDTGAEISALNEKYIDYESNNTLSIKNSQSENHSFKVFELDELLLGNLDFDKVSYIPLGIEEWNNVKGFFNTYDNKDSIA